MDIHLKGREGRKHYVRLMGYNSIEHDPCKEGGNFIEEEMESEGLPLICQHD